MKKLSLILFSTIIIFLFFDSSYAKERSIGGHVRVIDGDTIEIKNMKIRLEAIDAPEKNQICLNASDQPYNCGLESKNFLEGFFMKWQSKGKVLCKYKNLDRYGRILGTCMFSYRAKDGVTETVNINGMMVNSGFAVAYRRYSKEYIKAEERAKKAKLGIWQGKFDMPEKWRRKYK